MTFFECGQAQHNDNIAIETKIPHTFVVATLINNLIMATRSIKRVLHPNLNYVGDLIAYHFNDLPFEEFDPVLMLAHHGQQKFEPHNQGLPFAPHPHRGFETGLSYLKAM